MYKSWVLATLLFLYPLSAATLLVNGGSDYTYNGQQLQTAIDQAQPGDTILVSPAVYRGEIVLRKKVNTNGQPITIQSSAPSSSLPGVGVRTGPQYSAALPQVIAQGGYGSFRTEPGASYYNLINLEMRPLDATSLIYQLLTLGSGGSDQTTLDAVPQYITVDRCYIHGFPNANFKQGIQMNSGNTNIINSYLSEFHSDVQDSTAITSFNGPGPFKIANNYLEAAGVNVIFGGAVPAIQGLIPTNILVAQNDFFKQLTYKNWDYADPVTYAAITQADPRYAVYFFGSRVPNHVYHTLGAYTPNVKNMFELKFAQDVKVDGNTFTNTYVQADQFGAPIVLTPRTEGGQVPWATVQRVTISNNIFRHQGAAAGIGDKDVAQTGPVTNSITFYNNLFDDLRTDYSYDYERLFSIFGVTNILIDHNTMLNNAEYLTQSGSTPITNFTYTNNIAVFGGGFSAGCGGHDVSAYACGFNGYSVNRNLFIGGNPGVVPASVAPNTFFPFDVNAVGFVSPQNLGSDYHNYALAATSPYKGAGLGGSDVGFQPSVYDLARNSGTGGPSAAAAFVKADTTTQGNWRANYGSEGYSVIGDSSKNPLYAAPFVTGQLFYTWAGSTTDARGLQKASNPADRIASTWYSPTPGSFNIDINPTDQATHQVALYCVDWDSTTRKQTVEVLDANGNVLNTQTLSGFNGGVYLVWNVSGHVIFRLTWLAGYNAVVDGLFFGGGSGSATAAFVKADTTTQGNWRANYGSEGYSVIGDSSKNPLYAAPFVTGQLFYTWAGSTTDTRGLQKASNPADRIASTWYSPTPGSFTIDVNQSDQATHQVALYCVDWDSTTRKQTVEVLDANGNVLNTQTLSGFNGGVYLVWNVSGHVIFRLTWLAGYNAVVDGLFFGGGSGSATAAFVKADTTTQGNWRANYGSEGYSVIGDSSKNPLYAAPFVTGQLFYTWAASTVDTRGLQKASNPADRIASTWYSPTPGSFTIDLNQSDQATHQVALYCVDWDSTTRKQTVEVLDANGNVLNTQTLSGFNGGVYLVWNVSGHVIFRFTWLAGYNAVVDGLFFGGGSGSATAAFVKADTTPRGNWLGN